MGLTFKENCPDLRNTSVVDIVAELHDYGCVVDVYDPWASSASAMQEYGISLIEEPERGCYDAVVIAVAHRQFIAMGGEGIRGLGKAEHVLYDLKYVLSAVESDLRL